VPDPTRKVSKKPIVVEVKAEGFVVHPDRPIHPEKTEYPLKELDLTNSPLQGFIKRVDGARQKTYLLLLLHSNGIGSYRKLRKYLLDNHNETVKPLGVLGPGVIKSRIDLGYEPFSREWLLLTETLHGGDE